MPTTLRKKTAIVISLISELLIVSCVSQPAPHTQYNVESTDASSAVNPAIPIPVHVLTEQNAGVVTIVEQGDFIEVRLDEVSRERASWVVSALQEKGRIEQQGESTVIRDKTGLKRVFRFRAAGAGQAEVTFFFHPPPGAQMHEALTFKLNIR